MTDSLTFPGLVRALGRGKHGTRSLTREEARFGMTEILADRESPAQLGAFLMLMRVKEEVPEELAGMAEAARNSLPTWQGRPMAIDWPAYAGKRRQPSWYVLAALALSRGGYPVYMHGGGEHTPGRQYARQVCEALDIPIANDWHQAQTLSEQHSLVYCPLAHFLPKLSTIIDMKAELGLRSPVNTLVRHLNPTGARTTLQGMFHPSYQALHHETARLLGDQRNLVLKGDSGEFEIRPDSDVTVSMVSPDHPESVSIPRVLKKRAVRPDAPTMEALLDTWYGRETPDYGLEAVRQTMAIVLMMTDGLSLEAARAKASEIWDRRLA